VLTPLQILCDFDGTIALDDVTDTILAALADPGWRTIEEDWAAGRIGSRACMTSQVALLRGEWPDLDRVVDAIAVDPHFAAFAAACASRSFPLIVVSDGLDYAINRILAREGVVLPVRANRLRRGAGGTWSLDPPFASRICESDAAHCKCLSLSAPPGTLTVVVGDGRSDVCVAGRAGFVFAKALPGGPSTLLRHCREQDIPHLAYETFADVAAGLAALTSCARSDLAHIKGHLVHA
jgi:2-hydroxy-3-keto-5-methylthiopentenyl-1-phosphate phosphatase